MPSPTVSERALTLEAPVARDTPVLHADIARSMRNAFKLALSLCGTWAVALAVRILLPRHLGPEAFGAYQFADAFTTVAFVVTSLGLDTYIQKEVPTRREHASDFFAGTTALRILLGALVLAASIAGVSAAGKTTTVVALVAVLGGAQLLQNANTTYGALLHAVGSVNGLAVLNVASKLLWGGGIAVALLLGGDVWWVGLAVLASEVLRTVGMARLARRHVGLRWRIDLAATRAVLRASAPFYVGFVATSVYGSIDSSIMSFLTRDEEVGWFGATKTLVGLSLVMAPLIGWVLMPLLSRSAARSTDELLVVARRGMELILTLAFPITLLLGLNAELAIHTAFGDAFAPAAAALRIEAPVFVLTYAAMVAATLLVRLERAWALTWISLGGMALSAGLNVALVPWGLAHYGPGGAGIGGAITLMATEVVTTGAILWLIGRRLVDRRLVTMLGKTIGICGTVLTTHLLLTRIGPIAGPGWGAAWARLAVDGLLYAALAFVTGAVDVAAARSMISSRHGDRATAHAAVAT